MPHPLNPLDWLKSAQDWFSKTEKSSGFRAYLIFIILVFGMTICLLLFFKDIKYVPEVGLGITVITVLVFLILYVIKSCTDPDFCRSESHIQKVIKLELEKMGTEEKQVEGEVIEAQLLRKSSKEPRKLPTSSTNRKEVQK